MKIKLAEIKSRHQALCMIGNKKLPIKLSYAISKNILILQKEAETLEKERIKLLEQYAQKDEAGKPKITDGHYELGNNEEKVNEEFKAFMNSEEEFDVYTVPVEVVDLLEDPRYDILTPAELISIDFMLEQPQAVTEEVEP